MHHLAYGWCLHTFCFRDKGGDSATPSESLFASGCLVAEDTRLASAAKLLLKNIVKKIRDFMEV